MHPWGNDVSEAAAADIDRLIDAGIAEARKHLVHGSEFDPIALVIDSDGRILAVTQDLAALGRHPGTDAIVTATIAQLRQLGGAVRCTAIIVNTRLAKEKSDAVEISVEHREGAAIVALLPYKSARIGQHTEYGTLKAFAGRRTVFL